VVHADEERDGQSRAIFEVGYYSAQA